MKFAETITGPNNLSAGRVEVPPVGQRPRRDCDAGLDVWVLDLPGYHAAWDKYLLSGCSLADMEGVTPPNRHYPEATHEIIVAAIDPDWKPDADGYLGVQLLRPLNYARQITTDDETANRLLRHLAGRFARGYLLPEPQGIVGATELFHDAIDQFLQRP